MKEDKIVKALQEEAPKTYLDLKAWLEGRGVRAFHFTPGAAFDPLRDEVKFCTEVYVAVRLGDLGMLPDLKDVYPEGILVTI